MSTSSSPSGNSSFTSSSGSSSFTSSSSEDSSSSLSSSSIRKFSLEEIKIATNNFDQKRILGYGGEATVYKADIYLNSETQKTWVAVKRLNKDTVIKNSIEFEKEIRIVSKIQHQHIVALHGYCKESDEKILIYEYMKNGSLSAYVKKSSEICLTWKQRLKICLGAAYGLHHLHKETPDFCKGIIHRDVKPANILLDEEWVAKVSDFGMFKVSDSAQTKSTIVTDKIIGTQGYFAPEYFWSNHLSRKADVYAFGVVLFEVLCGKKQRDRGEETYFSNENENLGVWARENVDIEIKDGISSDSLKAFTDTIGKCLQKKPKKRPTMDYVVRSLELAIKYQKRPRQDLNFDLTLLRPEEELSDIEEGEVSDTEEEEVSDTEEDIEEVLDTEEEEVSTTEEEEVSYIETETKEYMLQEAWPEAPIWWTEDRTKFLKKQKLLYKLCQNRFKTKASKKDVFQLFAEKVRDHKDLVSRWAVLEGTRVEYFRGKDFVSFLRNHPEIKDILDSYKKSKVENIADALLKFNHLVRCDRVEETVSPWKRKMSTWPAHLKISPDQVYSENDAFFSWTFVNERPLWQTLLSLFLPVLTLAFCFISANPRFRYLSAVISISGILLLTLGLLLGSIYRWVMTKYFTFVYK